uniref:SHNi-TPR domain-containing protein n=1 Tax=Ascaris lumbricoides TaxID=6252 RepID=A0A0M3I533_ASCLU
MSPAVAIESDINNEESVKQKEGRVEVLFAEGKRAYIIGDLATASDKLGEASKLVVELHGDFAIECFDPLFYYGKAMLELASVEDRVFTNALPKEEADDDEEDDEIEEQDQQLVGDPNELREDEQAEIIEKVAEALEENMAALEKRQLPAEPPIANDEDKQSCEGISHIKGKQSNKDGHTEQDKKDEGSEQKSEMNGNDVEKIRNGAEEESEKTGGEATGEEEDRCEADENEGNLKSTTSEGNGIAEHPLKGDAETSGRVDNVDTNEEGNLKDANSENGENAGPMEEVDEDGTGKNEGSKDEESLQDEESDGEGDAQDNDVEYIQIAWEALEVARTICENHIEVDGWKEKKADVLLALCECSVQNANYKQAIDDVDTCIELLRSISEPNDRRIAEAFFQKARTYALDKQFDNAAENFSTVKELLESRLASMEKELKEQPDEEKKATIQKEVNDLKGLIPEVQVKIDDSRESAKNAALLAEEKTLGGTAKLEHGTSTTSVGVTDITGLVRKKTTKRTAEGDGENAVEKMKRAKCVVDDSVKASEVNIQ